MIIEYEIGTGQIFHVMDDPIPLGVVDYMNQNNLPFVELSSNIDWSFTTHYVSEGVLVPRPVLNNPNKIEILKDDLDEVIFPFVPQNTQIFMNNEDVGICNDGQLVFSTSENGPFEIQLLPPFPYQPASYVITTK